MEEAPPWNTDPAPPRRYSRSVSQLKSLTRCGEAFYLERIARPRVPRIPAAWSVMGVVVHTVFQKWEESGRDIDVVKCFEEEYDRLIEEEKSKQPDLRMWQSAPNAKSVDNDIANYRKRGATKDVPLYRDRCLAAEWEIMELPNGERALELPFELDLDGVTVRGALDRIQWWPALGMASMEDTKTGSPDDEVDCRQLAIYRIAALECYDIDLTHGRYWFTKLDRPSEWTDLRRYNREYVAEQYVKLDKIIDQQLFLPQPGKKCGLCGARPWCREQGWLSIGQPLFEKDSNVS